MGDENVHAAGLEVGRLLVSPTDEGEGFSQAGIEDWMGRCNAERGEMKAYIIIVEICITELFGS